ncbi:MAG: hypothetical protein ABEI97_01275, partial [Candidatus Nanohaloarchaea archaeon]
MNLDEALAAVKSAYQYERDTGKSPFRAVPAAYRRGQEYRFADERLDELLDRSFQEVEAALGTEFEYDTSLLFPEIPTLGLLYKQARDEAPSDTAATDTFVFPPHAEEERAMRRRHRGQDARQTVEEIEEIGALTAAALVEGDIRDALQDEEFEDFASTATDTGFTPREVAATAGETLKEFVYSQLDEQPPAVRGAYRWAVSLSEQHQAEDAEFREIMERLQDGDETARTEIRDRYKWGMPEEDSRSAQYLEDTYSDIKDAPYFWSQYLRVGVIYDGMLDMYRGAGFDISEDFQRSLVSTVIAAQVLLDDVEDFEDDLAAGQLTPVTAEY